MSVVRTHSLGESGHVRVKPPPKVTSRYCVTTVAARMDKNQGFVEMRRKTFTSLPMDRALISLNT